MNKIVEFIIGGLLLFALTDAHSCKESHNPDFCPEVVCEGGKVLDENTCCYECAKQKGEKCGGRSNVFGVCDDGLICEGNHKSDSFDGINPYGGVCQPAQQREFFISAPTRFRTQHEASGYCQDNGGRGLTYTTENEYDQVMETLNDKFSSDLKNSGFWTAMVMRTKNGVKEIVTPSGETGWASWASFSEHLSNAKLNKNFQYAVLHTKLGNYRPGSWIRFLSSWNDKSFYAVCQKDVDECASNPCQNGAQCVDGVNGYTCECDAGFTGENCQTDIDECASTPCQNGAECADGINKYKCACACGFTGENCQTNIDECASSLCQNGAKCVDGINGYTCECGAGFTGENCQTDIDECASNLCQNGAQCVDGMGKYTCKCAPGYTGENCQTDVDECASNPCQNGAQCVDGVNGYTCVCAAGFVGDNCQDVDECASNPCQNGAQCVAGTNGYTCECAAGFTGANCQTDVDECASNPCQNAARCVDEINGYTCECTTGFVGENCAKPCQSSNGYNYRYVETPMNWQQARSHCKNLGGDLAHHGFESMAFRREVYCGHLNLCNDGNNEWIWFGLTKVSSSPVTLEYLDGTPSPDDDTWYPGYYDRDGWDCAHLVGVEGNQYFLRTASYLCSYIYPSICEVEC